MKIDDVFYDNLVTKERGLYGILAYHYYLERRTTILGRYVYNKPPEAESQIFISPDELELLIQKGCSSEDFLEQSRSELGKLIQDTIKVIETGKYGPVGNFTNMPKLKSRKGFFSFIWENFKQGLPAAFGKATGHLFIWGVAIIFFIFLLIFSVSDYSINDIKDILINFIGLSSSDG